MIWYLTLLLICLAGVFNAFADTLQHHFDTSIFRNLPRKWFDPNLPIREAPVIFKYPVDAWHIAGSAEVVLFCVCVVFHRPQFDWYIELLSAGVAYIVSFNLFYNKIFIAKKYRYGTR